LFGTHWSPPSARRALVKFTRIADGCTPRRYAVLTARQREPAKKACSGALEAAIGGRRGTGIISPRAQLGRLKGRHNAWAAEMKLMKLGPASTNDQDDNKRQDRYLKCQPGSKKSR
jgi:hypothetical protein